MHTATSTQFTTIRYNQCLRWLFLATIILVPFSNALSLLLPVIGLLTCLSPTFRHHWRDILSSKVCLATGLLIIIVLLHTFNTTIPAHAVHKELLHYLIFIPTAFIGLLFLRPEHKKRVLTALLISASIMAVAQLIYHYVALPNNHLTYTLFIKPSTHHLQDRGPFLAIGFFLAACTFLNTSKTDNTSWFSYAFYLLLSCLFAFAVFSQGERVGYLCLIVGLIILGYQKLRVKGATLAVIICALLITAALKWIPGHFAAEQQFKSRVTQLWHGPKTKNHNESTQKRIDGLHHAWNNIKYKPLWGFGVGTFHTAEPTKNYIPKKYPLASMETAYAIIAAQLGLIGFVSFILLLASYWNALNKLTPENLSQKAKGILILLCTSGLTFPLFFGTMGLSLVIIGIGSLLWTKEEIS